MLSLGTNRFSGAAKSRRAHQGIGEGFGMTNTWEPNTPCVMCGRNASGKVGDDYLCFVHYADGSYAEWLKNRPKKEPPK